MKTKKLILLFFTLICIGFNLQAKPQEDKLPEGPLYDLKLRTDVVPLDNKDNFVNWRVANYPKEEKKLISDRWDRAAATLRIKDITNQRVLEAFLRTPREFFIRKNASKRAYEHATLVIGYGVTISGPHMVARMTDVINPDIDHKVLEIGTGSGYQSAVLSQLSNYVYTIEIIEPLAKESDTIYTNMDVAYPEFKNIHRKIGDGYYGWEENAPFDRIIVTCGIDHIPPPLLDQLKPGGIMVIPVGPPNSQTLLKVTKNVAADGTVTFDRQDVYNGKLKVVFVPFTADKGTTKHSEKRDNPGK